MNENEGVFTVADLNEALKEAFVKVEENDLGTDERKEAHKERMDLLDARIKMQTIIDAEDQFQCKLEEEAKHRKRDRAAKIFESIAGGVVKIFVSGATTLLSLKLFDFAATTDGFLTKDRATAINQLNKNIT